VHCINGLVKTYIKLTLCIGLGSRTVVHPKARIIAEAGPIIIGEGNLIEERCEIINRYVLRLYSVKFLIIVSTVHDLQPIYFVTVVARYCKVYSLQ